MEIVKAVVFSLTSIAATMIFKAVETTMLGENDVADVVAVQYDLLVISFGMIISGHAAAQEPDRKDLFFEPLVLTLVVGLIMLGLLALVALTGAGTDSLLYYVLGIGLPDLLGFLALGRAAYVTREARSV